MQQPLPFTVLKRTKPSKLCCIPYQYVATALTVYGIETPADLASLRASASNVATALTVYGIETNWCTTSIQT